MRHRILLFVFYTAVGSAQVAGIREQSRQELTSPDGLYQFGYSVAVSGDTAIIGANGQGAAYVYERFAGSWMLQQKLTASDGYSGDGFGLAVSVNGDTAVIGAASQSPGAAYVFLRNGGVWILQQKLMASGGVAGNGFGWSVSVSGDTAAIGARMETVTSHVGQGAAYVFVRKSGVWTQQQELTASDGDVNAQFGYSISVSEDTAVVGAPFANSQPGTAYVFVRSGGVWSQQQKMAASDGVANDLFGISVSLSADTAFIGAPFKNSGQGATYMFVRSGGAWGQQQQLTAYDGAAGDNLGWSVSLSGETAVIGANQRNTQQGAAYVFARTGEVWSLQQKLVASDGAAGDNLGWSVSMGGDTTIIGAINKIASSSYGAAYVFTLPTLGINALSVGSSAGSLSQSITFGALTSQFLGSSPFTVSAIASSGLPVTFASTTSGVCAVSGAMVTLLGIGTCTIQATQAGNSNYAAATPVNQSFAVQGSLVTFSVTGSDRAAVHGGQDFTAMVSCSAADSGPTGANAACSKSATVFATDGSGASSNISITADAKASYGHIQFDGSLHAVYYGGAYHPITGGTALIDFATASYSYLLDFGGLAPSSIQLTFRATNPGGSDALLGQSYSVTLGGAPTQTFQGPGPQFPDFETQTFVVDPAAGSVLLTVQGTCSGQAYYQIVPDISASPTMDLIGVQFLDANGNPITAPLRITTSSVPVANQYHSYSTVLAASGGTQPYMWTVVPSTGVSLPEGMSLDAATGIVSATQVNGQGGYAVTMQVSDSNKPSPHIATATLNFGVNSDSSYGGCQMFPADSIFNQRIDRLPVDTTPSHQIPSSYLGSSLRPDFGHGFYPGPGGIPFLRVPADQPAANVNLAAGGQMDSAGIYAWPFPPWPDAAIEGTSLGVDGGDHHVLVLQSSVNSVNGPQVGPCKLFETYQSTAVASMYGTGGSMWFMYAGAHYQLDSNQIASSEDALDSGSQDSAGIPILPLLVRYSEVPLGVQHPLRITLPAPTNWFVWPATGCCAGSGPPQGLLYRLKSSVNWQAVCAVSTNPQAATVLQALQQYGAYMSAHGNAGFVQGVPDVRWDDTDLACIKNFKMSDLEVVDNAALEVSDISGQTQPSVVPATLASGTVGTEYSAAIAAVGGNPATRRWLVSSGALPPGLTLDAPTGTIGGTPISSAGSPFTFGVTATDTSSGYTSHAQSLAIGVVGPALQIVKSHMGNFTQGQNGATYTLSVSNAGSSPTSGTVTVTEIVPAGLTLASMNGGPEWNCTVLPVCTTNTVLNAGSSYPAITVIMSVATNAPGTLTNQASVAGGRSATTSAVDSATVTQITSCDVNRDGNTKVSDVQAITNEALAGVPAVDDLNRDGTVNVADVQKVINAALGLGCSASLVENMRVR